MKPDLTGPGATAAELSLALDPKEACLCSNDSTF